MNNKTLRRIITKTLGAKTREDLAAAVASLDAGFRDNFLEAVDTIDKAITDLDRMIEIRDRSLSISSKEMVALNDRISAHAAAQQAVLDQLHSTLQLLSEGRSPRIDEADEDLNTLVQNVDNLVKRQLLSTRDLKVLFEEGLRISSVLSFKALEAQLQESITKFSDANVKIKMYFAGHLFAESDPKLFYACNEHNGPAESLDVAMLTPTESTHYQTIHSTKGSGILAFIRIDSGGRHDEATLLERIRPLLPNVAATLENIRLLQEEKRKQHLEAELLTARFVQQALIPASLPITVAGGALEISGYYQNAAECGGDWWSYLRMKDGRHIVLVGDVTGHGTGSAMVCAVVKGYCDSFIGRNGVSLSTMLAELNDVVFRVNGAAGRAMTMAAVAIDPAKGEVTFSNAGHPHPIVVGANKPGSSQRSTHYLVSSGNILGIKVDASYSEKTYPFLAGDQLVIYSDGLTEYVSRNKDMYGDQRLRRMLAATKATLSAAELNRAIIRDVRDFSLGEEPADDVTAVVIKSLAASA